jgi:hypothetical protein
MRSNEVHGTTSIRQKAVLVIGAGLPVDWLVRAVAMAGLSAATLDDPVHGLPKWAASHPAAPASAVVPWLVTPGSAPAFMIECLAPSGHVQHTADALVLPIDLRERLLPFPGFELAGVGGIALPVARGDRVLVVGPSPWREAALAHVTASGGLVQAAAPGLHVIRAMPGEGCIDVTLANPQGDVSAAETDRLMVSDGWVPATDIFRLLRTEMQFDEAEDAWLPRTDRAGRCSVPFLYALRGTPEELAATIQADLAANHWHAHHWPDSAPVGPRTAPAGRSLLDARVMQLPDEAVICPCERITAGEARSLMAGGLREINQLKSATRCGMGECGGRLCEDVAARLLASAGRPRHAVGYWSGRAPLTPLRLISLTGEYGYGDIPIPAAAPL